MLDSLNSAESIEGEIRLSNVLVLSAADILKMIFCVFIISIRK